MSISACSISSGVTDAPLFVDIVRLPASPQSVAPTPVKQSNSNNIGDDITDAILRPETDTFGT